MALDDSRPQLTTLLASAAVGVYLLVVVGATASFADAAQACSSWPGCEGALSEPGVVVALGHRIAAVVVGLLVLLTGVVAVNAETTDGVKLASVAALVLYPAQMAVGAMVATGGPPVPGLHLFVGITIFGALVLALAWQLEATTGERDQPLEMADVDRINPQEPAEREASQPQTSLADRSVSARLRTRAFAYFRLMKPRLMWLLSLVAAAGMALAAGPSLTVGTITLTLGGGVLAIGASGTFNHVLERDRDRKMSRTNDRPVATHQVPKRNALVFGFVLAVASVAVFLQVNLLTALLGVVAIAFYSVIYTLVLKPNTVQNTVIGGAAGALPALIGWVAVTGRFDIAGIALAGLIFVWTPAHFYNLALAYKEDYARGGFPMMPVVRGETTTRKHILLWLGATLAATSGLIWLTDLGTLAAATTVVLGAVFLWAVVRLHHEKTEAAAFRAFHASNAYLGLVLCAIVVDALAV
ncbi:MAG: heme o synthase [Halovenus sp.]